jgi:predicted alpha/beta hydrolase family esterase
MKKRVFIIHGWGGSPEGGCIPWLKKNLEKKGFKVFAPQMPNAEEPKIEEWVSHLAKLVGTVDENTYFIGHSIGCQAIMHYLQTIDRKIGGTVFIAGWVVLNNLDKDELEIAKPWIDTSIDFKKLKSVSENYSLIISDNDPFGGFEENKEAFEKMDAKIAILQNAGHIEDAELPIAFEELLRISK